jgi:beta-lactamase regulating signal transducer with metallopeptidase domain
VDRQRTAELAVVATLVFLVLALVPLPRWSAPGSEPTTEPTGVVLEADAAEPTAGTLAEAGSTLELVGSTGGRSQVGAAGTASDPWSADVASTAAVDEGVLGGRSFAGWVALGYGVGSALAVAYLLLGLVLVRRLVSRAAAPPQWLAELFAARCAALGVRSARLRLAGARCRPVSAGVLRPTVVLPAAMIDPRPVVGLTAVIDHELAHVRRRDAVGRLLFAVAATVLWPHPLFWWLRARAALAAELIADDVAAGGTDRHGYARSLLMLAESLQLLRPAPGLAPGTFRNHTELAWRIEMLTNQQGGLATRSTPARRVLHGAVALAAIGVCAGAFGARSLPAQEPAPRPAVEPLPMLAQPAPAPAAAAPQASPIVSDAAQASPVAEARDVQAPAAATPVRPEPEAMPVPAAADMQAAQQSDPEYEATLALVDRAISLRTERDMAASDMMEIEEQAAVGIRSERELRQGQQHFQGLERRLQAVLILVRAEIQATQLELAEASEAIKVGTGGPAARVWQIRAMARLEVLQSAL